MNKQEASSLLKEVLVGCKLGSDSFVLVEPNPNDALSTGYKVKVTSILDNECRQKLKGITINHNCAVIEEKSQIIIYKPKSDQGNIFPK